MYSQDRRSGMIWRLLIGFCSKIVMFLLFLAETGHKYDILEKNVSPFGAGGDRRFHNLCIFPNSLLQSGGKIR